MTRATRFTMLAGVVIASLVTVSAAGAQSRDEAKSSGSSAKTDSVTIQDVHKAAEQLAEAVHAAVRKATEDPAVKVAALKVAKNAVVAAQIVITQQAETLQAVLDSLAREIAVAAEKQQAKAKSH